MTEPLGGTYQMVLVFEQMVYAGLTGTSMEYLTSFFDHHLVGNLVVLMGTKEVYLVYHMHYLFVERLNSWMRPELMSYCDLSLVVLHGVGGGPYPVLMGYHQYCLIFGHV